MFPCVLQNCSCKNHAKNFMVILKSIFFAVDRVVKLIATEVLEPYLRNMQVGRIEVDGGEITE